VPQADCPNGELPYLLMVSTLEPRKNHQVLLDAWELLRSGRHPGLHLVCVGSLGWDYETILQRFAPWLERGGVHFLHAVPANDLRLLYRHARATVCPSLAEGFDYSGIEAMRCGGTVVASDIEVHKGVYGGAAEYFSPYAPAQLAAVLDPLIDGSEAAQRRRDELVEEGLRQSSRYTPEALLPQWAELLARVRHAKAV
jgi:glycosyltransferase involved in cell wall biosynthesis